MDGIAAAEGYALLSALWRAQAGADLARGEVRVPADWLTRALTAALRGQPLVERLDVTCLAGGLECRATVRTPLGAMDVRVPLTVREVRVDTDRRRVVVALAGPVGLAGGGPAAWLAGGLLGADRIERELLTRLAARPGVHVAGREITVDLSAIPAAEAWAMRPILGHPACHYAQVVSAEPVAGALLVRLRTGLS